MRFLTKIGLRKQLAIFGLALNTKKMVRELSKTVFISEQSSQFFVKFSTKYLQHRLKKKGGKFKSRLVSYRYLLTLGTLTVILRCIYYSKLPLKGNRNSVPISKKEKRK